MKRHIAFLLLVGMVAGPSPAQDGENLLVNGGFEDGFDPWWTYGDVTTEVVQELEGAAAPQAPAEGDHALQIMVAEGVPNFWNAGLGQGRPFEEGKVYTFSAFLKAPQGEMQINYKPEDGVTFAAPGGEMTFTFGEEWTEFSMTTPVMAEAVPAGQVIFHVAFATPGTFWMDGIRFYEGEYVEPDFEPGPVLPRPCPTGGSAEIDGLDGENMVISWSNGDTVPTSVDITRNGELIADDADAAAETYTDPNVPPGAYDYELIFEVTGEACDPVSEEVDSCISGLSASNREEGVRLVWTNARLYDTILILRDGEEIDSIPGDDIDGLLTEYYDPDATEGLHTYGVVPDEGICDQATVEIDVAPPVEEGENLLVNGGFEDGISDPWWTYGDVTIEVVQELAGANVPQLPAEGDHALQITVNTADGNFWDAGLGGQGVPFEFDKVYTLSAFLKSPQGEMQINFKPEQGCCGFLGFGEQQFTFGEEWTEFSVTTPPMAEAVPEGQTVFHVAYVPGVFWMDGVRFYEGPYVPPDFGPDPDGPVFLRGDCNGDGQVDIADVICVVNVLFPGFNLLDRSSPDLPCSTDAGNVALLDTSGNETLDVADVVGLASSLFGPGPVPGPECEVLKPELGCSENPGCQ